ncbi:MAG TPA: hypothetical protein VHQ90_12115 [Thermoanaerobaculia bacterium]|nr:hypothetical protein [Thermoanaerobaculia bacterium]
MARLVELISLVYLLWFCLDGVTRMLAARRGAAPPSGQGGPRSSGPPPATETLVPCAGCGVYVPSSRTLGGSGGEVFCSETCRSRGSHAAAKN